MTTAEKILVVDDDVDLVETLRTVLEANGYRVATANSAEQGYAQVDAERPDLILLDVMMPAATEGFRLIWQLRNRPEPYFRTVPIIMLTAIHEKTGLRFYPESSDGTFKEGEHVPVQDFLDKPVESARLLEKVRAALTAAWRKG